jgi:5-methylcytosine-specific restriction enzyme subunit McrC
MQLGKTAPEVWLLYPLCDNSEKIGNPEFYSDDGVRIHIFFVDVDDIEESINELRSRCFYNASKSNENP